MIGVPQPVFEFIGYEKILNLFIKTHEIQKIRRKQKDNQAITKEHMIYVVHH